MSLTRKLLAEALKGVVVSLGAALGTGLADRVLNPPPGPTPPPVSAPPAPKRRRARR